MSKLAEDLKSIKRELLMIDSAIIVLGVLIAIFPETSGYIICYVVGAILAVLGLVRIITFFVEEKTEAIGSFALVEGTALLIFGVYFLLKPEFLATILTAIFAIVLIIGGVMKLQYAFNFLRLKVSAWWVELICALAMVILGIVAFLNPFGAVKGLMLFLGISLAVDGVLDLISVIYLSKVAKDIKETIKSNVSTNVNDDIIETTAEHKDN
jgi:uncharacterized membrane protein HdeD (DUF308 family)